MRIPIDPNFHVVTHSIVVPAVVMPGSNAALVGETTGLAVKRPKDGTPRRAILSELADNEGTVTDDLRPPSPSEGCAKASNEAKVFGLVVGHSGLPVGHARTPDDAWGYTLPYLWRNS
jgi:hypothetical protein